MSEETQNQKSITGDPGAHSALHNWRVKKTLDAYRWYTRQIKYPAEYRKYASEPVDERKVCFVEIRFDKLSNSMTVLRDRFAASDDYDVHEWFLRQDNVRHRDEYRIALECVRDLATARYIVICEGTDVIGCLDIRPETYVLQTWHGCGLIKKCGFSTAEMKFGRDLKTQLKYPLFENADMVTAASPEHIRVLEETMHLEGRSLVKPVGVSRSDVFYDDAFIEAAVARVNEAVPAAQNKKVILYCPTFRGEMKHATTPDTLDIKAMCEALSDEYILIIKHHPLVKDRPAIPDDCSDFAYDVTDDVNIEDLICASDICISDYSSIIFEFSIFERPIIFYAPDRAEYAAERGMYYDYDNFVPGPIYDETEDIIEYIGHIDEKFDSNVVSAFRDKYMSSCDGHATDRILDAMGANA